MVFRTAPGSLLSFIVLHSLLSSSLASPKCYNYDGTQSTNAFTACNDAGDSMCCLLGESDHTGDVCGSGTMYGLCGINGTQLSRESCTDPTWKSPACLKLCVDGNGRDAFVPSPAVRAWS
jgi:hypothetical protein